MALHIASGTRYRASQFAMDGTPVILESLEREIGPLLRKRDHLRRAGLDRIFLLHALLRQDEGELRHVEELLVVGERLAAARSSCGLAHVLEILVPKLCDAVVYRFVIAISGVHRVRLHILHEFWNLEDQRRVLGEPVFAEILERRAGFPFNEVDCLDHSISLDSASLRLGSACGAALRAHFVSHPRMPAKNLVALFSALAR